MKHIGWHATNNAGRTLSTERSPTTGASGRDRPHGASDPALLQSMETVMLITVEIVRRRDATSEVTQA